MTIIRKQHSKQINNRNNIKTQFDMDLSQYKMIRSNKFPLPKSQGKVRKSSSVHTMALISSQQPELYEVHIEANSVAMFNEHEYLRRQFNSVHRLLAQSNEAVVKQIMRNLRQCVNNNDNNLIIFNALDLTPVDELIFPWRQFVKYNSDPDKNTGDEGKNGPECAIKALVDSVLQKKKATTVVTLSVMGIRSDGSIEDELNYEWIEDSKYIEDLVKIKKRRLKVKKYRSEVKILDLNRQQIKEWGQAEQILYHYSQIKQYLQSWKQELEPKTNQKIGELYEVCQISVNEELGYITKMHRRKCLLKFHQFLPQSNLIMTKIAQLLKQSLQNVSPPCARDFQIDMFLKDFFEQGKDSHYTLLTQIGTNQSLKQQAICLNMDLQFPGLYTYFKNYRDKPDILQEVKHKARNFNLKSPQEMTQVKIASIEHSSNKLKPKSISALRQGEVVASKSYFFQTFSSNQKKKSSHNSSNLQGQSVLEDRKNIFEPYQYQKPSTTYERGTEYDKK